MSMMRNIFLTVLACLALSSFAQTETQGEPQEWYLDEVVNDVLVERNDFEYYYQPSTSDMEQQRAKGEVAYFLNTPTGLNRKKACDLIDEVMASYDDIKAVGDWHVTTGTYWKEFRFEKNKFRFTVKRKALEDGTYYVSVTESANYYKSLGKKNKETEQVEEAPAKKDKPTRRSTRDRKPVTQEDVEAVEANNIVADGEAEDTVADTQPVVSEKERRRIAREQEEAKRQAERLAKRRAQEEKRAQEKAMKEAEKQRKAEEKAKKAEEKRLKREQAKQQREQERLEKEAARKLAAAPKPVESKYHYTDVALWLSEKYDFTQTADDESSCAMFSTAVKDVEMAKLAIKNALKGSNARMAVPWRLNSETQAVETGYTVDNHVLIFTIGKNEQDNITLTITEVTADQFEMFKQGLSR